MTSVSSFLQNFKLVLNLKKTFFKFFSIQREGFALLMRHSSRKAAANVRQGKKNCRHCKGENSIAVWMQNIASTMCFLICLSTSAAASDDEVYNINLSQQSVAKALAELSRQTDIQVLFPYNSVKGKTSNAVKGKLTALDALKQLLQGTGLRGGLSNKGVLVISVGDEMTGAGRDQGDYGMSMNSKKNLLASTIAFFVGASGSGVALGQESAPATSDGFVLEEIVITASRRETGLNSTPISVAAIGGEEISRRDLSEMKDYLRTLPGINLFDAGVGLNAVVVRGLAMDPTSEGFQSSPTTGVYFGEVSMGGLSVLGGNADLKMIDLERVEVLRGPQGTLFGSSALAGAVRNIPNAPEMNVFEGSIKAGYSNTDGYGGGNTKFEGVINMPLIDDILAVRAVAYRHDTSGYIKNIAGTQLATNGLITPTYNAADAVALYGGSELYQDKDDVGSTVYNGGRFTVLWTPTEKLGVTLQYITQDIEQEGVPYVQFHLGGYTQAIQQYGNNVPALSGKELGLKDDISITNLVVEYDLGWAMFLSSSAWMSNDGESNDEISYFLGGAPLASPADTAADAFTQELRLVSQLDGPFQYVAGVYYEERDRFTDNPFYISGDLALFPAFLYNPFDASNPQIVEQTFDRTLEQLSFYSELSYDLTEQLTLTGGLRRFDYERTLHYFLSGSTGFSDDFSEIEESGTSFKVNLSYQVNDHALIYGQWAEGFRLGNSVVAPPTDLCDVNNDGILDGTNTEIRESFDSDNTESFELGVKLGLLEERLQINAAIYQIDWEGIPLTILPGTAACPSSITANAGKALSQGFEIETIYQLSENLRISLGGAYTNAELTDVNADVSSSFSKGDRLPSSPESSVNLGLEYGFYLGEYASYMRGDYAYVSDFFSVAGETGGGDGSGAQAAGDYGQLNMSAGVAMGDFNIELVANNLTNEDALTHVEKTPIRGAAYRLRPRTIGLNVVYQF